MSNKKSSRLTPDARAEQIVKVASEHFARHGYGGVSLSEIAVEAGVARALVYHYFPGKGALLEAVLRREGEALLAATAPDPTLPASANLARALDAYLLRFRSSEGELRGLCAPQAATSSIVAEITASNHAVQTNRLLGILGLDETPRIRLALAAWLAFVEEAARISTSVAEVSHAEVVALCLDALQASVGDTVPSSAPGQIAPIANTQ